MPIQFNDVRYAYKRSRNVFSDLTLEIPPGRTVLLGPNGTGKSTLLGLAASALRPMSGTITLGDLAPAGRGRKIYAAAVGWLPQRPVVVPGLSVREQVAYHAWLKGVPARECLTAAGIALEKVGLSALADRKSHQLSGGESARAGIAATLSHQARVLLLDEPAAALDPLQRDVFDAVLSTIGREVDMVVSTHDVAWLNETYDQVMVLNDSRIVFSGTVSALMELGSGSTRPAGPPSPA